MPLLFEETYYLMNSCWQGLFGLAQEQTVNPYDFSSDGEAD